MSSHLFLAVLLVAGCGRRRLSASREILVYCTPAARPYVADRLRDLEQAAGRPVTLAPVSRDALRAVLAGAPAGDYAMFLGHSFAEELSDGGLLKARHTVDQLRLCVMSRKPLTLEDLAASGVRLGSGTPGGALGKTGKTAVPVRWRSSVENNIVHRSERSDELIRMVALGGLDAALVWQRSTRPEGLHVLRLTSDAAVCPLVVAELTCSRLPGHTRNAVARSWSRSKSRSARGEEP